MVLHKLQGRVGSRELSNLQRQSIGGVGSEERLESLSIVSAIYLCDLCRQALLLSSELSS